MTKKRGAIASVGSTVLELENTARDAMIDEAYMVANDFYTRAIALDPENPRLFTDRAQSFIMMRGYKEAVADAEAAIKLDASMAKAHARKGRAYLELAKNTVKGCLEREDAKKPEAYELPVDMYTEAIRVNENNAHLYAAHALAHIRLQNFTEAVADAEKAILLDRSMAKAHVRKGIALCGLAKQALEKALLLDPAHSQSILVRGLCTLFGRAYERYIDPTVVFQAQEQGGVQ